MIERGMFLTGSSPGQGWFSFAAGDAGFNPAGFQSWFQTVPGAGYSQFMFGDADAGETSATLNTVIENARRLGIDPEAYLTNLLIRLPTLKQKQLVHHTPAACAKIRKTRPAT